MHSNKVPGNFSVIHKHTDIFFGVGTLKQKKIVSYAHQGWIYFIKTYSNNNNIVKYYYDLITVCYFNIFKDWFIPVMAKLNVQQSEVSHDLSEMLIWCSFVENTLWYSLWWSSVTFKLFTVTFDQF